MEWKKEFQIAFTLQCTAAAAAIIAVLVKSDNLIWIFLLLVLEALAVGYWIKIAGPVIKLEKYIKQTDQNINCQKTDEAEILFHEELQKMIERYARQGNKENMEQLFDKQAQLTALQTQINPHFLYNTLESIRGQALIDDNEEIAKMVEALAAFFRYSISRKGKLVTLREELANIKNYMMIQRYRFNNRFALDIFIDEEDQEAYEYLIPKLIIQPVVENAIFHGLEEAIEGGKVVIEAIVTAENMILTVSDNGKGMKEQQLAELNERIRSLEEENGEDGQHNTGIALPNIHRRIQLLFGEEYGVNVYSTAGQGTDVEITVPAGFKGDRE